MNVTDNTCSFNSAEQIAQGKHSDTTNCPIPCLFTFQDDRNEIYFSTVETSTAEGKARRASKDKGPVTNAIFRGRSVLALSRKGSVTKEGSYSGALEGEGQKD